MILQNRDKNKEQLEYITSCVRASATTERTALQVARMTWQ